MIRIRRLSMRYALEDQHITVLDDVDLDIRRGESVAIVGPSGSGKTTLLLLLAGLERPASGTIAIEDTDLAALDADGLADLRRDHLGIIFQSFHLIPSLTALGNVALPLEIAGSPAAAQRARHMLERVGLGARVQHHPAQMSGGEQQRVAIARALVHQPSLVLADEPTGNLDEASADTVLTLLRDLVAETGAGLILVTHSDRLAALMPRRLHLRAGVLA